MQTFRHEGHHQCNTKSFNSNRERGVAFPSENFQNFTSKSGKSPRKKSEKNKVRRSARLRRLFGELGCSHESLHVGVGLPGHERGGCEGLPINAVPALAQEGWDVHEHGHGVVRNREHERGSKVFLADAGEQIVLSAVVVPFPEQGRQKSGGIASP